MMAAELFSEVDNPQAELPLLPPGEQTESVKKAPVDDGSFLIPRELVARPEHADLSRNEAYANYMRMHKVLVGNRGATQLEGIYEQLRGEGLPHYLSAAGWAAAESALVRSDVTTEYRLSLLDDAVGVWNQALISQQQAELEDLDVEHGYSHRIALDIAVAPLLAGMITKDVTKATCERVFDDCLMIAKSNITALETAKHQGDSAAIGSHAGIGYECNALLAFNRRFSKTWFVIPTMARCDSGYYYRGQTHDLIVVHQKYGVIHSATPVEIKSKASLRDRKRYEALLIRGKMHLSAEGKTRPEYTLAAIAATRDGTATEEDHAIANNATNRFEAMVRDYYAGELLGKTASKHSVTGFRDNTLVVERHPGLSKVALAS